MTTILFKCRCMDAESAFDMPARRFNEDAADFVKRAQAWMTDYHRELSPFCRAATVEYIKLPVPEDGRPIGASPKDAN
jgi:hypothetical protein